ncbi:RHS repeat protein [Diaphorobacter sp. HDW4B]|uniref:DUF6531 domain-containing protein n=1 Tax=Diaphorobacter sp. HDW4B TaxID=2714925 RepID=UPI00140C0101|nr:DUF6531 domain-containing protein [Diaphorobacter sp. HDW4B]QIL71826.1 RHS repeat protein [Diaphorobacter sp. HDW4B]
MANHHHPAFTARNLWCDPMELLLQQALQSRRFRSETTNPFFLKECAEVDLSSGAKVLDHQLDLCLPDPMPLTISRSYSSQHSVDDDQIGNPKKSDAASKPRPPVGLLGPGWWLPHEASLSLHDEGLTLHNGPARHVPLPVLAPGEMTYSAEHGLWVVRGGSEQLETGSRHPAAALRMLWRSLHAGDRRRDNFFFIAHHALGPWWIFGPHRELPLAPGQRLPLRMIRDRFGRMLRFGHDPHTGLATVAEDSSGRQFRLELKYFPQLVRKTNSDGWGTDLGWRLLGVHIISDAHVQEPHPTKPHQPAVVRYEYTMRGELAGVYSRSETLEHRFVYDDLQPGRIAVHARADRADVAFDYDNEGRVVEQRTAGGLKLRFQYDDQHTTSITDSLGRQQTIQFAKIGDTHQAVRIKRADSSSVSRKFDLNGHLIASTDALGRTVQYERDEVSGLLLSVHEHGGKERRMVYNAQGQLVRITLADGEEFRYQYDLIGRLVAATGTATRTTRLRYAHDETHLPSLIEDARGDKLHLQWTAEGLLASFTDIHGQTTRFEHDRWGGLTHQHVEGQPATQATRIIRDNHGRRVDRRIGTQQPTTWQYNLAGDLINQRDTASENNLLIERDAQGRVLLQQLSGHRIEYRYDAAGRLIAITGKKGGTLRFAYDTMDRIVEQTNADGSVKTFRYNTAGELFDPTKIGPLKAPQRHTEDMKEKRLPKHEESLQP